MRRGTCFVLGAGASFPDFPLTSGLPDLLASMGGELGSFAGSALPITGFRRLLDPSRWLGTNTLLGWKISQMSDEAVALILRQRLAETGVRCPPQYQVFSLFSREGFVLSFNWDGLARRCCPQRIVLHVHGAHGRNPLPNDVFLEMLDLAQLSDEAGGKSLLPGIILPGEEEKGVPAATRWVVEAIWRAARRVVVVGYSFGVPGNPHDEVWRETFIEMMRYNKAAGIHIVNPDPAPLAEELRSRLDSRLRVIEHPVAWDALSGALLGLVRCGSNVRELIDDPRLLQEQYVRAIYRSERVGSFQVPACPVLSRW